MLATTRPSCYLLPLHLKLLLLLLLLLDEVRVHLGGAGDADDRCAEVTDRVLRHRRQRGRLLASLLLRAPVKVQRHAVDAGVQHDHRGQRDPEVPDLQHRAAQPRTGDAIFLIQLTKKLAFGYSKQVVEEF